MKSLVTICGKQEIFMFNFIMACGVFVDCRKWSIILCYIHFMSMDNMANTLLVASASLAMVHAVEEITKFTAL